jgi:hypothetical protein
MGSSFGPGRREPSPLDPASLPPARERRIQVNYQRRARRAALRCRKEINARRPYPTANPKTNPIRSATATGICKSDVITPQHSIETLGCRRRRAGKNGIMILGPKDDGTYVVEFEIADGTAGVAALDRNAGGDASICSEAPRVRMISPSVCRSTLQSTPNLTPYAR